MPQPPLRLYATFAVTLLLVGALAALLVFPSAGLQPARATGLDVYVPGTLSGSVSR